MKLSVSTYSFQQYIGAGKMSLTQAVDKAAEMGFEGIEFIDAQLGEDHAARLAQAKDLRERVEKTGLSMVAYAVGAKLWQPTEELRRAEVERVKGEVDVAAALGVPVMRHDLTWATDATGAGRSFLGMIPTLAQSVREITEYAAAKGIRTCSENHGRVAQDSYRMEAMVNAVAHDNYGLLVDVGNFLCVDEAPVTAVSRVANFAFHVHAKDMEILPFGTPPKGLIATRGAALLRPTAVGQGSVPVEQCLHVLKRAGYDGWVSLEYEGKEDCLIGIAEGLENLRLYLSRM